MAGALSVLPHFLDQVAKDKMKPVVLGNIQMAGVPAVDVRAKGRVVCEEGTSLCEFCPVNSSLS